MTNLIVTQSAMIKKIKNQYVVMSEKTGRVFGRYRSKTAAKKRLQQMEMFKHLRRPA